MYTGSFVHIYLCTMIVPFLSSLFSLPCPGNSSLPFVYQAWHQLGETVPEYPRLFPDPSTCHCTNFLFWVSVKLQQSGSCLFQLLEEVLQDQGPPWQTQYVPPFWIHSRARYVMLREWKSVSSLSSSSNQWMSHFSGTGQATSLVWSSLGFLSLCWFLFFLTFFFFWPCRTAWGILVRQPGIKPGPSAVRASSPNHWTAREFRFLTSSVFKNILPIRQKGRHLVSFSDWDSLEIAG